MIYNENREKEYKVRFYRNIADGCSPVLDYVNDLSKKERAKVSKYIIFLCDHKGILDEPYSRHIKGKIRELRVDLANNRHRIFYFTFVGKTIVLSHAFLKKTAKTPPVEIKKAEENYKDIINNKELYE